ncbi:cold shock domain-containing protein E1-like isoform X2 [Dermacentor silvarum]|uniref:cold shock domain-containing protein E1-like isoform X2 n=1 Tax=Dermacentor silvarum TaxID=543639 RepID=UPI0021019B3B|nr:cold shock domain-containing protein E1-like isoform X2 [Dermacentor silvarum]
MASAKWQASGAQQGEDEAGDQASSGSPRQNGKQGNAHREAGIVEKLLHSYGFIRCCERSARLFFHYSQFTGNIEHLRIGDPVEFEMTNDRKSGKPVASAVVKISSEALSSEVLSDEVATGFITTEAKDGAEGRVAYESRGECFFLPYTEEDIEEGYTLHHNDSVRFYLATCKETGAPCAKRVRPENAPAKGTPEARGARKSLPSPSPSGQRKQGVVCALKDTFGFIERGDVVKEIFFHSSECGDFRALSLGEDVEFTVQLRNGKEVACNITRLAPGTVVFEDVDPELLQGRVTVVADRGRPSQAAAADPLPGRIVYTQGEEELEMPYGERDPKCEYSLQVGDQVQFSIATDRRDGLQRATNIELLDQTFANESRQVDPASPSRFLATRIRRLWSVCDDQDGPRTRRSLSNGDGSAVNGDESKNLRNRAKSGKARGGRNGFRYTHRGYIAALKESFGFIENEEHNQDVFFHFSVFEGNPQTLEPGQEVEYGMVLKGTKRSAECVRKLPAGTLADPEEVVKPEILNGTVERPVRCFNPDQEQYAGLIRLTISGESAEPTPTYPFGITSLTDKHELLQKNDVVQFQVATTGSGVERAVNVVAVRARVQATVEAIKGQFGFLSYEAEEGRKLFFHTSEVKSGNHLQVGDRVEFVVVYNQRTKKYAACSVIKVGESQPTQRPERLVSRLRTLSTEDSGPRIIIVRQPRGPDGTNGFASRGTEANPTAAETLFEESEEAVESDEGGDGNSQDEAEDVAKPDETEVADNTLSAMAPAEAEVQA